MKYKYIWCLVLALGLGNLFGALKQDDELKSYEDAHTKLSSIRTIEDPDKVADELTKFFKFKFFNIIKRVVKQDVKTEHHTLLTFDHEDDYKIEFEEFLAATKPTAAAEKAKMLEFGRKILQGTGSYIALGESLWGLDTNRFNGVVAACSGFFDTPLGTSLLLGRAMLLASANTTPAYIGKYFSFGDFFKGITDKITNAEKATLSGHLTAAGKKLDADGADRWAFYHHMLPLEHMVSTLSTKKAVVRNLLGNYEQAQKDFYADSKARHKEGSGDLSESSDGCWKALLPLGYAYVTKVDAKPAVHTPRNYFRVTLVLGNLQPLKTALSRLNPGSEADEVAKQLEALGTLLEVNQEATPILFGVGIREDLPDAPAKLAHPLDAEELLYRVTIPLPMLITGTPKKVSGEFKMTEAAKAKGWAITRKVDVMLEAENGKIEVLFGPEVRAKKVPDLIGSDPFAMVGYYNEWFKIHQDCCRNERLEQAAWEPHRSEEIAALPNAFNALKVAREALLKFVAEIRV